MAVLGQPDPIQPIDTRDEITRFEVKTLGTLGLLERVEFACSRCHRTYWREVLHEEQWTEEVEVEGVLAPDGKPARYALNPTIHDYYAPNMHQCGDASSL